jgi:hypothetical protein
LYYKITQEDLEEITKDWSTDLLIPTNLAKMSEPELDSSEAAPKEHETPRTRKRKNTKEVLDLSSASEKTASISPSQGGDHEIKEINAK